MFRHHKRKLVCTQHVHSICIEKKCTEMMCFEEKNNEKTHKNWHREQIKNSNFINAGHVCYLFKTGSN